MREFTELSRAQQDDEWYEDFGRTPLAAAFVERLEKTSEPVDARTVRLLAKEIAVLRHLLHQTVALAGAARSLEELQASEIFGLVRRLDSSRHVPQP